MERLINSDSLGIILSVYVILPAALDPGVYSDSNRSTPDRNKHISWSITRLMLAADSLTAIYEPIF
jgi:hypothetical protein